MSFQIRLEGLKEFKKHLEKLEKDFHVELQEALFEGAGLVSIEAKEKAPRGERNSASTIHPEIDRKYSKSKTFIKIAIKPADDNWQLIFPEYGTAKQRSRPFLRPALEENKENIERLVMERFDKIIRSANNDR